MQNSVSGFSKFTKAEKIDWLISNHFQGLEGQRVPEMSDDYVNSVSERYVELYENITSEKFLKSDSKNISQRIFDNTENYLKEYFEH